MIEQPKQLSIKLETKLNVDEDTKQKLENFFKALDELPKELRFDIGIDGNFNSNEPLKFNLKDIIIDRVKEHFGDYFIPHISKL